MATITKKITLCDICLNKLDEEREASYKCSLCDNDICSDHREFLAIPSHSLINTDKDRITKIKQNTIIPPIICRQCVIEENKICTKITMTQLEKQKIYEKYKKQLNKLLNQIHQEVDDIWNQLDNFFAEIKDN